MARERCEQMFYDKGYDYEIRNDVNSRTTRPKCPIGAKYWFLCFGKNLQSFRYTGKKINKNIEISGD